MSIDPEVLEVLQSNIHLLTISILGGLVLFGLKLAEHFKRDPVDKMSKGRYTVYAIALFFFLPLLALIVTSVYLINGDKISPVLAFQVGLTSPAIAQGMIIAAANTMAKKPADVPSAG